MTGPRVGDHGEWDALAVGWALSTLDAADETAFAAHLPGCERCAAAVRESLHTVADMAYALPDEVPPPALKERLMAAVRVEPRRVVPPGEDEDWFARPGRESEGSAGLAGGDRSAADGTALDGSGSEGLTAGGFGRLGAGGRESDGREFDGRWSGGVGSEGGGSEGVRSGPGVDRGRHSARDGGGTVVPFERPTRRRWTQVAAAAAVLVLLGALGAWNLRLRADRDDLRELAAQRDATIQQLTANGPARIAALTANGRPSASRRATVVVRGNQVEIITEGLTVTSGETTYWLWTLRCDTDTPTDLRPIRGFTVPEGQFSVRDIGSDPGFSTATCFAISEEPGPATPTAPTEVVAVGQPQ